MSIDNQIEIPPSFIALFVKPGRSALTTSHAVVLARYEQCEDLALVLMEQAQVLAFKENLSEKEVLTRCRQGLLVEEAAAADAPTTERQFAAAEAEWVVRRLAELLDWAPLEPLAKLA